MAHSQHLLKIPTQGKSFHNITRQVQSVVAESGMSTGLCVLFLRHTSASLVIQENADPDVLRDLETFLSRIVPEGSHYRHSTEGSDDMPAHIRTALTHTSEYIPICQGSLGTGIWQGIYVWEHRQQGSNREVIVHLSGE
ncbi:MAG: YjbQ family protein [Acaryochloris sp. RU_4_1]|nr:YjbQ family protein [Acaryochloris sp. SU_5_25]NJM65837.1 YjbQ family protein [Acaryochloris sp. RU_4_1]NJN38836.1 YjbQ family protein [Acaryochloridaceae cyanobacterium CSU_3_4]NJR54926.1 YjbQ family protein [Acaryochloris sp. CRU_2_0]